MLAYNEKDIAFITGFGPYVQYLFSLWGNPRKRVAQDFIMEMRQGKRPRVPIPAAILRGDHTPSSFVRERLAAGYTWFPNALNNLAQYCDGAPRVIDPVNPAYRAYDPQHPPAEAWKFGVADPFVSLIKYEVKEVSWWSLPPQPGSLGFAGGPFSQAREGVYFGSAEIDTYPEGWLLALGVNERPGFPNGGMFVKHSDEWGAPYWYEVSPEAWNW